MRLGAAKGGAAKRQGERGWYAVQLPICPQRQRTVCQEGNDVVVCGEGAGDFVDLQQLVAHEQARKVSWAARVNRAHDHGLVTVKGKPDALCAAHNINDPRGR